MAIRPKWSRALVSLLALSLALPPPAQAGFYEWISEKSYQGGIWLDKAYLGNAINLEAYKPCGDIPASTPADLLRQAEIACQNRKGKILDEAILDPALLSEELFFEAAREDLEGQNRCARDRAAALLKDKDAMAVYEQQLKAKVEAMRIILREERAVEMRMGWLKDRTPVKVRPEALDSIRREYQREWKELKELHTKLDKAWDLLVKSIPFSDSTPIWEFIKAERDKLKHDDKTFDLGMRAAFKKLQKSLEEQRKLVSPRAVLSRSAREDVIQNRPLTQFILEQLPIEKNARDALRCRLESRYGAGTEFFNNALGYSTFLLFGPGLKATTTGGVAAASAAGVGWWNRTKWIFAHPRELRATVQANALRLPARTVTGLYTLDMYRDFERNCMLTSPDHSLKPKSEWKDGRTCGSKDLLREMYSSSCLSFFGIYAMIYGSSAFKAGRGMLPASAESGKRGLALTIADKATDFSGKYYVGDIYVQTIEEVFGIKLFKTKKEPTDPTLPFEIRAKLPEIAQEAVTPPDLPKPASGEAPVNEWGEEEEE